jgi:Mce-associated membrane protein
VEDQQPATGDLTDAIGPAESEGTQLDSVDLGAESTIESPVGDVIDDGESGDDDAERDEPAGEAVEGVRERRPVGKWLAIAASVAAVLFVGSAAFAGAAVQPYLSDRATVATKLLIARTAAKAITTLWTYTPDNMDKLPDRAAQYLSGDFQAEYRKYIDAIVAPNRQAQITNSTEVTGAAVESLDGPDATAIVYTNTTSTSPATKDLPALKYLSYRLVMKREHSRWLVTKMTTVTSLDLTPKF